MSIVETTERTALPPSIRVRLAGPRDCEALTALLDDPAHAREQVLLWLETPGTTLLAALFDELDEFHRRARPDFFQPFDGPARTARQIEQWLSEPASTVLVAERGSTVIGLAVLLTRAASPFAGAVPRKVIELDNLVV